jgi:hypothetical protein
MQLAELAALSNWAEDECSLTPHFIGREGLAPRYAYRLEMSGRHLCYEVRYVGTDAFLAIVSEMDQPASGLPLKVLFPDSPASWDRVRLLISSLETSDVRSLDRPIELLGSDPPIVIG